MYFFFFSRTPSTTSKPPKSRGRPPFLRPIAKFTDIKISALENIGKKKQNKQNNNAPVDDTDKDKPESKKCLLEMYQLNDNFLKTKSTSFYNPNFFISLSFF